jgi:hypothetical protein
MFSHVALFEFTFSQFSNWFYVGKLFFFFWLCSDKVNPFIFTTQVLNLISMFEAHCKCFYFYVNVLKEEFNSQSFEVRIL